MKKISFIFILIILFVLTVYEQEYPVTNPPGEQIVREEERRAGRAGNDSLFPVNRPKRVGESLTKEGRALLKPSENDYERFREFLKRSKTGIAKIFPDVGCNRLIIDAADQRCILAAQMIGQGAYYSFRKKNNDESRWFDIYFAKGEFSVIKAPGTIGFWKDLGDVPIESLEKDSSELALLQKYQLPKNISEFLIEKSRFEAENSPLTTKINVKLNETYGLRLAYWTNRYYGGEDIDILLVLRVINESEDGSVTFVWRELQRKGTPKLK
ncbi:MAG: hypothetical protein K1X72_20860 [Pyrinomonadaceae bacterium]|nr:hypothetical protein [Pyrinomonadaceae bacterium]